MQDRERQWTTAWVPITGDTLSATIRATNWEREGDSRSLPCGFFVLDSFEFSGWPVTGSIKAVSVPADGSFMATERTKTWENVTIQEIGKEIAGRANIALAWDVEGDPITLKSVEQSEETDCAFYMSLCDTYGLAMKVYAQKIVVYDREAYKKKDPDVYKRQGYESGQALLESEGLQGALEALKGAVNNDELAFAGLFSSVEAQTAVLAMAGTQADNLTSKTAEMYEATGAANAAFEKQTNTLAYDIQMIDVYKRQVSLCNV